MKHKEIFKHFNWKFTGIIVMYLVNYTSELFKGALNNNWNNSWVNKKSDIFTKTQKLGRIDRFQVSVLWTLEFMTKRSDIKEIARPENRTSSSRIQSAVAHSFTFRFNIMKLANLYRLKKQAEIERHRLNSWTLSSIFRADNFIYITSFC